MFFIEYLLYIKSTRYPTLQFLCQVEYNEIGKNGFLSI